MYEIQLAGAEYTQSVEADEVDICGIECSPYVRMTRNNEIVFFAPFDSIISIRKVELCRDAQSK